LRDSILNHSLEINKVKPILYVVYVWQIANSQVNQTHAPINSAIIVLKNGLGSEDFAHTAGPNLILLLNAPTLPIK